MDKIRVGILGLGTVGSGVVNLLNEQSDLIRRRLGVDVIVGRIADRSAHKKNAQGFSRENLNTDYDGLIDDPGIDIVAELIGGTEDARKHILRALSNGKPIVTANKAVLAVHGEEIFASAQKAGCPLGFEASVAGGIPIVRNLREAFAADRIEGISGILNGTCNYILTEMAEKGVGFAEALRAAQELGYAEADPAFDIDGVDACHKIAILANLAYGTPVDINSIPTEGIRAIDVIDIGFARELGYQVKLIAIARQARGKLDIRIHPAMLSGRHPLAQVGGVFNSIAVSCAKAGPQTLTGQGAGSAATASAVVGDIIDISRWLRSGSQALLPAAAFLPDSRERLEILSAKEVRGSFYIRFSALDAPGVLSQISGVFGNHAIGLETILQKGRTGKDDHVPLVIMTYEATEESMQNALKEIMALKVVAPKFALIRVESDTIQCT